MPKDHYAANMIRFMIAKEPDIRIQLIDVIDLLEIAAQQVFPEGSKRLKMKGYVRQERIDGRRDIYDFI